MKISNRVLNWAIIGYCSTISFLSVANINGSGALNKTNVIGLRFDYLLHVLLMVPWMVLMRWRWGKAGNRKTWFWISLTAGLVIAALSELVQWLLPYRAFNTMDFLANGFGIIIGALIAWWGGGRKVMMADDRLGIGYGREARGDR